MRLVLIVLLVFWFVALGGCPARSHEAPLGWSYPTACCNDTDCREVDASKVIEERQGYRVVSTGELVPHQSHKLKNSPDGLFHLCTWKGRDDTAVICLFAPPKGF